MAQEARGLRKRHLRVSLGFIPPAFQCQAGRERRRCEVATYDSIHWIAINLDREPGCNSGRVRNLAVVGERTGFGASFRRAKHDRYPGRGIWARSAQTGGERVGYTSDSLSGVIASLPCVHVRGYPEVTTWTKQEVTERGGSAMAS